MKKLAIISLAMVMLTGCWDKVELNDRAYVNGIAIDKSEEKDFAIGISISDLQSLAGNDKGGEEDTKNKSVKKAEGKTVSTAVRSAQSNSSQKLFLGHMKTALLGEELLNDSTLLKEALDSLERDKELSRKILVMATEKSAVKTLEIKPQGEPSIGVYLDKFYKENESGTTFKMNLEQLLIQLRSNQNAIIPKLNEEDGEIKVGGAALLKDMTLCGFLNESETRGYLWQNGKITGTKVVINYNGTSVPFTTLKHIKSAKFYENERGLVMHVTVDVDGSIDEYTFGKTAYDEKTLYEMEQLVKKEIIQEIITTNRTLQNTLKVDVADVRNQLKKKNYKLFKKYEQSWQETYENLQLDIEAHAKIRSIGVIK